MEEGAWFNLNDSRSKSISFRDINTNEGRCTIEHSGEKKIPGMASGILHCTAALRSGKLFFLSVTVAKIKFVTSTEYSTKGMCFSKEKFTKDVSDKKGMLIMKMVKRNVESSVPTSS